MFVHHKHPILHKFSSAGRGDGSSGVEGRRTRPVMKTRSELNRGAEALVMGVELFFWGGRE